MSYRLRSDESVVRGLRRLAKKELKSARDRLRTSAPSDESIHEARKSVKKVRAIVHLVDSDDGRGLRKSEKRLRTVNRVLSPLRDADAMLEMLAKLKDATPRPFSEHTLARVRRQLSAHKSQVARKARRESSSTDIVAELDDVRRSVKRWKPADRGFRAVAPGIRESHRRGRKALARAKRRRRPEDFHEWRKQMKALWYELRVIESCAAGIGREIGALHRAERWLGDDHNLVVLCEALSKDKTVCRNALDLQRLECAAEKLQRSLRKRAIAGTRRIYSARSGAYLRRIERAWTAWRRQAHAPTRRPRVAA